MSSAQKPLVERAGWAVFWNVAFFPLKLVVPFLAGIVLVRQLRADGFAVYVTALALLDLLGLFSDFGIERTLPRFLPEVELMHGRRGILRLLGVIGLIKGGLLLIVLAALALFPSYWISQFNLGPDGGWILLTIGFLLVLGALSDVSMQLLYTHFRQKTTNSLDVLVAVVRPSLTASFVLLGWGAAGALLALLITTVVAVAISVWLAGRLVLHLSDEPNPTGAAVKTPSNRPLRTRLARFAGINYMINWSVWLYDLDFVVIMIPLLILSDETAKVESAAIALAYKFTKEFLRALVVPLTGVQTPLFARLYGENRIDGLRTAYATITKVLLLILVPSAVGLLLTGGNLLNIIYGQRGGDAVFNAESGPVIITCMAILAIGLFGEAMISVAMNVLMVYEDYPAVITARLVSLVSIPLMIVLVPSMGAIGGAIAISCAALGSRLVALGFGLRRVKLQFPLLFFGRVGTASAMMGLALLPLLLYFPPTIPVTLGMIALGIAVFYAVFRLVGGMDREDKDRLLSMRLPFVKQIVRFL